MASAEAVNLNFKVYQAICFPYNITEPKLNKRRN